MSLSIAATVATPSFSQQKPPTTTTSPAGKVAPAPAGTNAQQDAILTPEQKQKLQEINKQYAPKR